MKAIDRLFVYWKIIDKDIGEAAKNCVDCARHKTDPTKTKVHYWEYPSMPWELAYVDFAGPIFTNIRFFTLIPNEITTSRGSKKQPKYSACRNSGRSEQGIGFVPEVPSTDVVVPDVSPSSAKVTETRSPPIPRRPFPRRSGRQPPKRLGL
ncbi:transposon Tf2-6 polyprotein [Trichonephila clavipes]|nr:transposon Tf2-6 polyprotein [Trichonephila clavipes]